MNGDGSFVTVNGPYGKMKFITGEEFETYMQEPEIVICDFEEEPIFEGECPTPAAFDSSIRYRGDSEDNYWKYCDYMTSGSCAEEFCASSFKDNCRDECVAAQPVPVPRP